jgi:hypothetical protein
MKRTALLMMFVLAFSVTLAAQQTTTPPYPEIKPAPKKGAPLDPADVDVLTGKTSQQSRRNYVVPYVYVSPYGQYDRLGVVTGSRTGVRVPLGTHMYTRGGQVAVFHPAEGVFVAAPLRMPVLFPVFGPGGISVLVGPAHGPARRR